MIEVEPRKMKTMELPALLASAAAISTVTLATLALAFCKAVWDGFQRSIWFGCFGFFVLFFCAGVVAQNLLSRF